MGMTLTQKILAEKAGKSEVHAGQLAELEVDLVLSNDIMTSVIADVLGKSNIKTLHDSDRVVIVLDHYTPCKDIKTAQLCSRARSFAVEHGIKNFYDVGRMGIEHALLPEKGYIRPGMLVIGADSHTCTYGALGAFSTGVGSTDAAAAMAAGKLWFQIPEAVKVVLSGSLQPGVSGKDVILELIGIIGVDGARYKSIEFTGEGISSLGMDDRFTVCNMAIEAGAKNGIFPVDDITNTYLKETVGKTFSTLQADEDAEYAYSVEINLDELVPVAAMPHLPSNVKKVCDTEDIIIQQVVIGSCTNGRIDDLRAAAEILRGRKVSENVRCLIIPATQKIYSDAIREGLVEVFVNSGCAVSTPTCGPCCGGHMGVLSDDEWAVSTTNRNFIGRMGPVTSKIILASPATAAASAICGRLTDPRRFL
ncbi:MAG: 3-isopropylmalate dehydratase large subunit [Oscillospiraceae bacterium]|nr:3-isopropylmalate dehydratase large subunit [Oscillospiraceae bacterium]